MFDRPGEFGPLFECVQAKLFRPEVQCWIHHRLALYLIEEEDDAVYRLQLTKHHWEKAQAARKRLTERECKAAWWFVGLVIEHFEELEELEELAAYYAG